ncbi:MAG: ABC-F family ATP-binding cassette domain-containing protein [Thermomicrobiaceae bacterium]
MTTILSVEGVSRTFITDLIFSNVTFQIQEREHVALVGVNGSGKSTLMRMAAGLDQPDTGRIVRKNGLQTTYLAQEATFTGEETIREAALQAFNRVHEIEREMEQVQDDMVNASGNALDRLIHRYGKLTEQFEFLGGYEMDHRTDQVLSGLGFSEDEFSWQARHLSGGQKTRLALAQALLGEPDLLLLDEPTNHLDLKALEWLEEFLRSWNRAFLVVSHDRYFLDRVTTRTLDMNFGRLEDYPAPYNRFVKLREERRKRWLAEYEAQQQFIKETEEFIRKYKAGQRTKEAQGRETRLARLERIPKPEEQKSLKASLPAAARSGRVVLTTKPMTIGYPPDERGDEPTVLVKTGELEIERGERVSIVGPNGGGKTTLLRTLLGDLRALDGTFSYGTNVKPAYYAQGHEGLDTSLTVLDTIREARPMEEGAARNLLGRYLFSDDDVFKPVSALSGGERSRLALTKLTLEEANFLILDEPTNHLDIESREALELLLAAYDGTILFVSHDRYFIDVIATRVWAIEDGQITAHVGNYSDYVRRKETSAETASVSKKSHGKQQQNGSPQPEPSGSSRRRPSDKEIRQAEKQVKEMEREIAQLEGRINDLSNDLAEASASGDVDRISTLGAEYESTQDQLDTIYETWAERTEELNAKTTAVQND